MSGATRTQVYLTAEQRAGLDERARVERKTMAHVIRDAVDTYLAADVDAAERDSLLADTFGSCPELGERVPSRDEWDRGAGQGSV
jgi:hypothetical protein